jgi:hypothetical protein
VFVVKVIKGDIWDFHKVGNPIVITTNCNVDSKGNAIMGRGIALEAKQKFPELPKMLGKYITRFDDGNAHDVGYFRELNIFTFPTKYNWRWKSDMNLIMMSAAHLALLVEREKIKRVYMVKPGCSNGQLRWEDVEPHLDFYLNNKFIVVDKA